MSSTSSFPLAAVHQGQLVASAKVPPFETALCGVSKNASTGVAAVNGAMCNSSLAKDDGSSGYGSPDSEIVDGQQTQ